LLPDWYIDRVLTQEDIDAYGTKYTGARWYGKSADSKFHKYADLGERNSDDAANLEEFLIFGMTNCMANLTAGSTLKVPEFHTIINVKSQIEAKFYKI
jgi:hypothetical protein